VTPAEITTERRHIIETRLGILCGPRQPTREQINIAISEADRWEYEMSLELWKATDATQQTLPVQPEPTAIRPR